MLSLRFLENAQKFPSKICLISEGKEFTREQISILAKQVCEVLQINNVPRGARIAILGRSNHLFVAGYIGIHLAGCVVVPVPSDAARESIDRMLLETTVSLILTTGTEENHLLPDGAIPVVHLKELNTPGEHSEVNIVDNLDADILFTTGTTFRPKPVLLSQDNLTAIAHNVAAFLQMNLDDIEIVTVPLSHSFGLGRVRCLLEIGHCLVLLDGVKNPFSIVQSLLKYRATGLSMVPAAVEILRKIRWNNGDENLKLRFIELGSATLSESSKRWLMARFPRTRICHHYGLTEASRAAFIEYHSDAEQLLSIGKATPGVEIDIFRPDGTLCAANEVGELFVKGNIVAKKYWGLESVTSEKFTLRGFGTGDLARKTPDGFIFLSGRKDDIINVGGLKIVPDEIEKIISQYPGVAEVACVGIIDPVGISGQRVKAYYVSDEAIDTTRIVKWLQENGMHESRIPVDFERVLSIPKTQNGKILRRLLIQP